MKVRNGFVSNSSSCSFIVTDTRNDKQSIPSLMNPDNEVVSIPKEWRGETHFEKQSIDYYDFGSRLNFAILYAANMDERKVDKLSNRVERIRNILKSALKERYGKDYDIFIAFSINWEDNNGYMKLEEYKKTYAYWNNSDNAWKKIFDEYEGFIDFEDGNIDHQSRYEENKSNAFIFKDDDSLKQFLFGYTSYVANRSDEEEPIPNRLESFQYTEKDGPYVNNIPEDK